MPVYEIAKTFEFSASHLLTTLPDSHPCSRLHGHNYAVTLMLGADQLDEHGFVIDYRGLAAFKEWIDTRFDHRHLNEFITQPTAEALAYFFYNRAAMLFPGKVVACRVSETPKTYAEYRPDPAW
jgi:6-pyruvoyltetrahydropterin/6-carboxytetrahydropterin synthase